ncbi:hypothetical protein L596_020422 [Steinernema carpocapsae]|uniref:Uncharacterized protein n=1 Tax=Steinernema carpocapsae TaxID=34508 RepID=A0A4U5MTH5_STECR|nr:hypothetical protein L596_020422 [Steinernema carpocapsae]
MAHNMLCYAFLFLLAITPCLSIRGALFRSGRSPSNVQVPPQASAEPRGVPDGYDLAAMLQSDEQFPAVFGSLQPSATRALFRRIQALYGPNMAAAVLK